MQECIFAPLKVARRERAMDGANEAQHDHLENQDIKLDEVVLIIARIYQCRVGLRSSAPTYKETETKNGFIKYHIAPCTWAFKH